MKLTQMKSKMNAGLLAGLLLLNVGCATAGPKVWEGTDCEKSVERELVKAVDDQGTLAPSEDVKILLASCEQERRDHVEDRRLQRMEMQMFRGESRRF